jgi:hypothetical protein
VNYNWFVLHYNNSKLWILICNVQLVDVSLHFFTGKVQIVTLKWLLLTSKPQLVTLKPQLVTLKPQPLTLKPQLVSYNLQIVFINMQWSGDSPLTLWLSVKLTDPQLTDSAIKSVKSTKSVNCSIALGFRLTGQQCQLTGSYK